ncbi:helix-turn-helix transcriptional regulator [Pedobacter caeni]|uniref:HTH cro/C1-type domain-containing protein n=1 Tax=Pedobacter caeni TaxID=288992 RepID=A0A1M4SXE1_9SPHI|nr:helix-turn-helix transcriptional regulator [Pedobacter caeni]SHE36885.1 hypothetical protein SAMN04488522_1013 [Pedobacter caeni]
MVGWYKLHTMLSMILNKGEIVERIVRNKIGISELARKLNVSRTSIYNWFEQEYISIYTICKIGNAIGHDFSNEFPEEFSKIGNKTFIDLYLQKNNTEPYASNSVQYWMNKYISLLEKHNDLLNRMSNSNPESGGQPTGVHPGTVPGPKNSGQQFSPLSH